MAKYTGHGRNASLRMTLGYCLLLTLSAFARPKEPCPYLEFSFMNASSDATITIAERSSIKLAFRLDTSHCPASRVLTYIYVKTPQQRDFCAIRLKPGECKSTNSDKCACVDDNEAVLTKTATRADSGLWVWKTGNGSARAQIRFVVQEASEQPNPTDVPSPETQQEREQEHASKGENHVVAYGPGHQETPGTSLTVLSDQTHGIMRHNPERANDDENQSHHHNTLITDKSLDRADNHVTNFGGVITAVVVVVVVVIIAIVGVVLAVVIYKRKRARKERASIIASAAYANVTDGVVMRRRSEPRDDVVNSYVPLCLVRHSGEEASETFINEAYLMTIPRKQSNQEGEVHP